MSDLYKVYDPNFPSLVTDLDENQRLAKAALIALFTNATPEQRTSMVSLATWFVTWTTKAGLWRIKSLLIQLSKGNL